MVGPRPPIATFFFAFLQKKPKSQNPKKKWENVFAPPSPYETLKALKKKKQARKIPSAPSAPKESFERKLEPPDIKKRLGGGGRPPPTRMGWGRSTPHHAKGFGLSRQPSFSCLPAQGPHVCGHWADRRRRALHRQCLLEDLRGAAAVAADHQGDALPGGKGLRQVRVAGQGTEPGRVLCGRMNEECAGAAKSLKSRAAWKVLEAM